MYKHDMQILLLSHISDLSGPTEQLENYLVKEKISLLCLVYNPLEYCRTSRRIVKVYNNGYLLKIEHPTNFKYGRIFTWVLDCLICLHYSLKLKNKYKIAICCDGLNVLIGLLLKVLGKVEKIIYYSIDWTPIRFNNKLLNLIYQKINDYSLRYSDRIWCVSKKMAKLHISKGVLSNKIQYVPIGVQDSSLDVIYEDYKYKTLVFLGALEKTKGIDLIIESWRYLLMKDPQCKLVVIGKTPDDSRYYEKKLEKLPNVELLGVISHKDVLRVLPRYGIGLAPYSPDSNSVSFYGDPSRIKDYLVCGLPVVVSSVPEISGEIERNKAGKIIDFTTEGLIAGVNALIENKSIYSSYRNNAVSLAKRYRWSDIFKSAFESIGV